MARYVDVNKVYDEAKNGYHSDFARCSADLTSLREVLEDTPTADVVDVVRCKDCCNSEQCGNVLYCSYFNHNVEENDYCSQGD